MNSCQTGGADVLWGCCFFCDGCIWPLVSGVMASPGRFLSPWFQDDVVTVAGVLLGEERHEERSEHGRRPAKKTTTKLTMTLMMMMMMMLTHATLTACLASRTLLRQAF